MVGGLQTVPKRRLSKKILYRHWNASCLFWLDRKRVYKKKWGRPVLHFSDILNMPVRHFFTTEPTLEGVMFVALI